MDRWRIAGGQYPSSSDVGGWRPDTAFRVTDVKVGEWSGQDAHPWRSQLVARADDLASNRLTFFNLVSRDAGDPIDWNQDLETGFSTPMSFAPSIDYRNPATSGDAKVVWEPNRHQHFVVLGRAYRATGDERYADALVAHLVSWLDQSPFGRGMNWRSPLELGIRIINWVWALDLIEESRAWSNAPRDRILHVLYLHLWEVTRKYSRGSSSNNHLIGEAAGIFVGTAKFPFLPQAESWHERSRAILLEQLFLQTHSDGGTREQATGYHLFTLQFFLLCGVVARRIGTPFPRDYWDRVELMVDFIAALVEGGTMPMIGDADDGYVVDLGRGGVDLHGMLAAGATVFNRPDLRRLAGGPQEWAYWLVGPESDAGTTAAASSVPRELQSRALPETGWFLLQGGREGTANAVSIMMDCGELGFGALAAHGHADALSIVLRVGGEDILVDPGTYDYFRFPAWREYFRSTRAHNTLTIDSRNQSEISGPFMWSTRAGARCVAWQPTEEGGTVTGEHDGYARLKDPVTHRRTVWLNATDGTIDITDEIVAKEGHEVEQYFHFGERCLVTTDKNRIEVRVGAQHLVMTCDAALSVELLKAGDAAGPGWVSRGYHQRTAAPAVVARTTVRGNTVLRTTIAMSLNAPDA